MEAHGDFVRWTFGVVSSLYLLHGVLIAVETRPQQLWACADASSPSGAVSYAQPPKAGCKPTVSKQEQAKSFAMTSVLDPACLRVQAVNATLRLALVTLT
jgi:hypothetical protein